MIDSHKFAGMVDRYFGDVQRLKRPGLMERFVRLCEGAPEHEVEDALARCADRSTYLPNPAEFSRILRDCMGLQEKPSLVEDRSEQCPVCEEPVREFFNGERWVRPQGQGGLMFRLVGEEWLAARCWECGGPERFRDLPVPRLEARPHCVPVRQTPAEEGMDMALAAMRQGEVGTWQEWATWRERWICGTAEATRARVKPAEEAE